LPPIDPTLEEYLAAAEGGSGSVSVWGILGVPGKRVLTPSETEELAQRVVKSAEEASHDRAVSVQVYGNLNAFSLDGSAALVRSLAAQPEIHAIRSAANEVAETTLASSDLAGERAGSE
jgi:hypothetical protein